MGNVSIPSSSEEVGTSEKGAEFKSKLRMVLDVLYSNSDGTGCMDFNAFKNRLKQYKSEQEEAQSRSTEPSSGVLKP